MNIKSELIGQILIKKGYCAQDDIDNALDIQKNYGQHARIGRVLINMGVITEEQLLDALSYQFGVDFLKEIDDVNVLNIGINKEVFLNNNAFPIKETDNKVFVLTNDPLQVELFSLIENKTSKSVEVVLTTEENLHKVISKVREDIITKQEELTLDIDEEIDKLKELASEAPVIKLVNSILSKAVEFNATDIHFESLKTKMCVRFRIDGVLKTFDYIPNNLKLAVIARLKLLSGMNIAESRLAQDGRIAVRIANKPIDIRSSSLPTQYGESFVLRLLFEESISYSVDSLGFYPDHVEVIRNISKKPNGIFLTTGPTGSGKTTTLYSTLSELNSDEVKIITVEDPIEYELEGINQVQVKPEIGRTFASALRNILRQDPDIIMVGEIRDLETAEMAIQASLTGHLVLSTLHTNSALASITRLLDMGVEWFLIKASVIGVMAQRLVRTVCPYCTENYEIPEELWSLYRMGDLANQYNIKCSPKKGKGCEKCNYTGYKGRVVISEIAPFDETLQREFDSDKNFDDMRALGFRTMREDGLLKVIEGKTTLEEVLRVT